MLKCKTCGFAQFAQHLRIENVGTLEIHCPCCDNPTHWRIVVEEVTHHESIIPMSASIKLQGGITEPASAPPESVGC